MIRMLERSFFDEMKRSCVPGGFVLISTFVEGQDGELPFRPNTWDRVLRRKELRETWFKEEDGWRVISDNRVKTWDGRWECTFLARKDT